MRRPLRRLEFSESDGKLNGLDLFTETRLPVQVFEERVEVHNQRGAFLSRTSRMKIIPWRLLGFSLSLSFILSQKYHRNTSDRSSGRLWLSSRGLDRLCPFVVAPPFLLECQVLTKGFVDCKIDVVMVMLTQRSLALVCFTLSNYIFRRGRAWAIAVRTGFVEIPVLLNSGHVR